MAEWSLIAANLLTTPYSCAANNVLDCPAHWLYSWFLGNGSHFSNLAEKAGANLRYVLRAVLDVIPAVSARLPKLLPFPKSNAVAVAAIC